MLLNHDSKHGYENFVNYIIIPTQAKTSEFNSSKGILQKRTESYGFYSEVVSCDDSMFQGIMTSRGALSRVA